MSLHGRLTYKAPDEDQAPADSNGRPPTPPPDIDEIKGEREISANGAVVRLGDKIVLRPGTEGDVYDKILDGRTATVERIYRGYDDRVYLGVTVDDDPGQDLLRETGRYLFFFADEVEPARPSNQLPEHEPRMPDLSTLQEPELPEMEKQILVAGVGNAWLGDDGFGGHVVNRLLEKGVPPGSTCRTSAREASTWHTRSCAGTTRWSWSTSASRAASRATST